MATIIDPKTADALKKEYQKQNSAAGGPALKTDEAEYLNGFFFDRDSLEKMLSDPAVIGLGVCLAKHPNFVGKPSNTFMLVATAVLPNPAAAAATPYIATGDTYGEFPFCPPWCY